MGFILTGLEFIISYANDRYSCCPKSGTSQRINTNSYVNKKLLFCYINITMSTKY